jgi:hypothetical protein
MRSETMTRSQAIYERIWDLMYDGWVTTTTAVMAQMRDVKGASVSGAFSMLVNTGFIVKFGRYQPPTGRGVDKYKVSDIYIGKSWNQVKDEFGTKRNIRYFDKPKRLKKLSKVDNFTGNATASIMERFNTESKLPPNLETPVMQMDSRDKFEIKPKTSTKNVDNKSLERDFKLIVANTPRSLSRKDIHNILDKALDMF